MTATTNHPITGRRQAAFAAALVLLWTGCASSGRQTVPNVYPAPPPEIELPEAMPPVSEGSLFVDGSSSSLVGDFRARRPGDVLMVRITESALASSSADSKLDKSSDIELKAPILFGWENKVAGSLGPDFDPSLALQAESGRNFEGSGETTRSSSLAAALAVRVMAVGVDGRMVVAGSKEITVNHDTQWLTLAGIVRPEDVGPSNDISSSKIADLRIVYSGRGDLNDVTRQGWFIRLVDKIWPF
jgi:flagellar L-ring protein precursor FlgH